MTRILNPILTTWDSKRQSFKQVAAPITVAQIIAICSNHFEMPVEIILGKCRKSEYVKVRHVAIYLTRKYTVLKLKAIAGEFNCLDHSSIHHALKCVNDSVFWKDDYIYPHLEHLEEKIKDLLKINQSKAFGLTKAPLNN